MNYLIQFDSRRKLNSIQVELNLFLWICQRFKWLWNVFSEGSLVCSFPLRNRKCARSNSPGHSRTVTLAPRTFKCYLPQLEFKISRDWFMIFPEIFYRYIFCFQKLLQLIAMWPWQRDSPTYNQCLTKYKEMAPSIGLNLRVTGHCNQGGRKYMEDVFSVAYQQTEDEMDLEYAFFGIFDGHGGKEAALFAKVNCSNIL